MKEKEKNNTNESILKQVVLEYEEVVNAAKNKLAENNSKELDGLIAKFLKESENRNEPFTKADHKESLNADGKAVEESTMIQKPIGESVKEESAVPAVNMKEASLSEVEAAFDGAGPDDEFQVVRSDDQQMPANGSVNNFDLTSIEGEIDEMMKEVNQAEQMQAQAQQSHEEPVTPPTSAPVAAVASQNPMDKMKEMYEGMGKFIKEMEEMNNNQAMMNEFHQRMSEMYGESYKAQMDEAKLGELFSMYKKVKGGAGSHKEEEAKSVAEVAAPAVDENHISSLSGNKIVGAEEQPRLDYGKGYAEHKVRLALQKESIEKKMTGLLKENLNLTKQLNKVKKDLNESTVKAAKVDEFKKLNEKHNAALVKYRNLLKEMAVFNTNLSYTNNLLVNESFALSMKDKENIIEKFKKVGSILESEQTYKKLLDDFTTSKKSVKESLEDKVNTTIVESSSAKKLEESTGEASNVVNEHIEKILKYSGVPQEKKQIV